MSPLVVLAPLVPALAMEDLNVPEDDACTELVLTSSLIGPGRFTCGPLKGRVYGAFRATKDLREVVRPHRDAWRHLRQAENLQAFSLVPLTVALAGSTWLVVDASRDLAAVRRGEPRRTPGFPTIPTSLLVGGLAATIPFQVASSRQLRRMTQSFDDAHLTVDLAVAPQGLRLTARW